MNEHEIKFGTLHSDGSLTNVRYLRQSSVMACPHTIFLPEHYRPDGSCKCDDAEERAMMIREWDYEASDFDGPVREEAKE